MQIRSVTVLNKLGIHARPGALLTKTANLFDCRITLCKDDKTVDAKSILSVMRLGAKCGDQLTLTTDGRDDIAAMESILALFQSRFGEDE